MNSTLEPLFEQVERWRQTGDYPFFNVINGIKGSSAEIGNDRSCLMFASCDYLGMSRDADVKQAAIQAIERFGTNTFGAQLFSGYTSIHRELEQELSKFIGKEACVLFPSGMHANIGTITALMGVDDLIINDQYNHVSIFMGSKMSGAEMKVYPHNNMARLERILKEATTKGKKMIIVDGLFSADGDYAPLDQICDLAEKYGAMVMVDEAHSIGLCGPTGRGVSEIFNVINRVDIIIGTMSKGLGSVGGFIVSNNKTVDVLRHFAVTYTSSRGPTPAVAAASLASISKLSKCGEGIRRKLWDNTHYMIKGLKAKDINILNTETPIIPVIVGDGDLTAKVTQWLSNQGLLTAAMVYPAVPTGRMRLGVTAWHSMEDCDRAIELISKAKTIYGF